MRVTEELIFKHHLILIKLNCHTWLVASILNHTGLEHQKMGNDGMSIQRGLCKSILTHPHKRVIKKEGFADPDIAKSLQNIQ